MKKFKLLIFAIFLIAVLGAGYYFWKNEYSPTVQAKKAVNSALVDPESSKFRDVEYFKGTGATCGYVNAKNRMGGYVGFTIFVVTEKGEVLLNPNADTESGPPKKRLKAINKQIDFLKRVEHECPKFADF